MLLPIDSKWVQTEGKEKALGKQKMAKIVMHNHYWMGGGEAQVYI